MKMRNILIGLFFAGVLVTACKKKDFNEGPSRLFRPVGAGALVADSNAVQASWQQIKSATSYTVQLSRDTFKTIDATVIVDTNYVSFTELFWNRNYQVQVRANATDTTFSSKYSYLGNIKTPVFPSILAQPDISDISDNAVRVKWTNTGAAVTQIRILKASDSSVVTTVPLTAADITAQMKIVTGLTASTPYIIGLYSGNTVRGWANFSTKAAPTGNIIDLRNITGVPSILNDTIPDIASGSTVLLRKGETYTIGSTLNFSKSVVIMTGSDLVNPNQAIISMPSNFNIASGSVIDSIVFSDVTLRGTDYASKYVFNINTACTIGKLSFEGVRAEIFRGIVRTQSQPAIINSFIVTNSIMDSLAGYGVITVDVTSSRADNIVLRNSTFYKAEKIITSRSNSVSVLIENCTFNETPLGGGSNYIIDYGSTNVTGGITVNNSIFGVGKPGTAGAINIRGIRTGTGTTVNANNNYRTSDHVSAGNDIPGITPYNRPSTQLFQDPANGNFKIIDASFPGRNSTGDPKWRIP